MQSNANLEQQVQLTTTTKVSYALSGGGSFVAGARGMQCVRFDTTEAQILDAGN